MSTYRKQMADLKAELAGIIDGSKAANRDLTDREAIRADVIYEEWKALEQKADKADQSSALVKRLAAAPDCPDGPADPGSGSFGARGHNDSGVGSTWAKGVAAKVHATAGAFGMKNLLSGQIATPPAVEVAALPARPTRLLDLIPREVLESNNFSFLRQTVATNNAAVVADGALKPTSIFTFEEVEDRARVVAHLTEPFPLRFLTDHETMVGILDSQLRNGVLSALENQVVAGDGTGENFTGLLTLTGVTNVAFTGDVLTTIRRAVTVLQGKNETPTAWVFNPNDAEAISLTREGGATGAFLFGSDYAEAAVFGGVGTAIVSSAVPEGKAFLADWRQLRIGVREVENTLAATQSGDLFETNRVKVRAEGRYGFKPLRPQAVAVVNLTA